MSNILVQKGILQNIHSIINLNKYSSIFILTDKHILNLWGNYLKLTSSQIITVPRGESAKTLQVAEMVWREMFKAKADSHSLLINLGGGSITDLGGFVAHCYFRGIDFINSPTTLLAQVDASIGGKTGVNFSGYKNIIGAFADPLLTAIDPNFLNTLNDKDINAGFAEVIKIASICDINLLEHLHNIVEKNTKYQKIEKVIKTAVKLKKNIIRDDYYSKGKRNLLNFGHTIGHSLETLASMKKKELLHGEAVAFGIRGALYLSRELGLLEETYLHYIESLIFKFNLGRIPFLTAQDIPLIIKNIEKDKKNKHGNINWILLEKPGKAKIQSNIPTSAIETVLYHLIS